jgi:hypothetical protein
VKICIVVRKTTNHTTQTIGCIKREELFSFNTPNRLRSVVGGFAHNYTNFHQQASYEFFTDVILRLNTSNPKTLLRQWSVIFVLIIQLVGSFKCSLNNFKNIFRKIFSIGNSF